MIEAGITNILMGTLTTARFPRTWAAGTAAAFIWYETLFPVGSLLSIVPSGRHRDSNGGIGTPKCMGCGHPVLEVPRKDADHLSAMEGRDFARAYECDSCRCLIFEDELVEGRFIPPQFREMYKDAEDDLASDVADYHEWDD
jgi:hypothetical protein